MNQPNLPVMAPKTAQVTENQDLLGLVRRNVWLLVAGAVAGAITSGAIFAYVWKYHSRYTARIPFQVNSPTPPVGSNQVINYATDDTAQVIHRQEFIFEQDAFLNQVLQSDEFHLNKDTEAPPAWYVDNKKDLLRALHKDLGVVARVNAAAFDITMTTRDPKESVFLVQAATKVYIAFLQEESLRRKSVNLKNLADSVRTLEQEFANKSGELEDFAKRKGIDVLRSRFEIEKSALQQFNEQFMNADAMAASYEAQYSVMKKKLDEGKEVELTADMQQSVENDPTLRYLLSLRLQLEQDMAAEKSKTSPNFQFLKQIEARMAEIDGQVIDSRKKLTEDARKRMLDYYATESVNRRSLAAYINGNRLQKEQIVRDLGQDLMQYQQKVEDLKEKQILLNNIRNQYTLAMASRTTDDTRVQQLIDISAIPDRPSSPLWYVYIFPGTFIGLGLSALLAYALMLTDTRVRTPRDISKTLQLTLLGFVPDEGDDRMLTGEIETAILTSPASMVAESFRQIRSHITAQTAHSPANTMLIASVTPGGGATTVAANFAAAMALNDLRVLLIDSNFYRPSFDRLFKGMPPQGLTDSIAHPENAAAAIVPHPSLPTLHMMGAGTQLAGASSEIFEGKSFRELLEQLKTKYDLIVFDGAPLNLVSDSLALGARVDGVVSVVRAGEVSRGAVSRVRDQLRGVHANLLGFVLNAAQTSNTGYFKEHYRDFYRYAGKNPRRTLGE